MSDRDTATIRQVSATLVCHPAITRGAKGKREQANPIFGSGPRQLRQHVGDHS
jgi:hypothetical protein